VVVAVERVVRDARNPSDKEIGLALGNRPVKVFPGHIFFLHGNLCARCNAYADSGIPQRQDSALHASASLVASTAGQAAWGFRGRGRQETELGWGKKLHCHSGAVAMRRSVGLTDHADVGSSYLFGPVCCSSCSGDSAVAKICTWPMVPCSVPCRPEPIFRMDWLVRS